MRPIMVSERLIVILERLIVIMIIFNANINTNNILLSRVVLPPTPGFAEKTGQQAKQGGALPGDAGRTTLDMALVPSKAPPR